MDSFSSSFIFKHQLYECEWGVFYLYYTLLYTYSTTEVELTVAGQKSKLVSSKMHTFYKNAISFKVLYSGFI